MSGYRTQALMRVLTQHLHGVTKVYPVADDPVTVTDDSSTTGWLEGAKVEVVPVDTITEAFDVTGLWVTADTADDHEIILYVGVAGSEIEIARVAFSPTAAVDSAHIPCSTPVCAANERISAAINSASNAGESLYIKLQYHEHDLE